MTFDSFLLSNLLLGGELRRAWWHFLAAVGQRERTTEGRLKALLQIPVLPQTVARADQPFGVPPACRYAVYIRCSSVGHAVHHAVNQV